MNCSSQPLNAPLNKKIEIIDLDLGLNLSEDSKSRIDTLDNAIALFTKDLIEREKQKQQSKYAKKKQAKKNRQQDIKKIMVRLEEAYARGDYWIKGRELARLANVEPTKTNITTLSKQIQSYLKIDNIWVLLKTRKLGRTIYRLAKFGD